MLPLAGMLFNVVAGLVVDKAQDLASEHVEKMIDDILPEKSRKELDKARNMSRQLVGFYTDLSSSFKGIDALIPRELATKNRNAIQLLAKANMQLAIIHRSKGEPELAVPLLVEVVKILSPSNPIGANAYQQLVELGLVDTPYGGASKQSL